MHYKTRKDITKLLYNPPQLKICNSSNNKKIVSTKNKNYDHNVINKCDGSKLPLIRQRTITVEVRKAIP